MEYLKLMVGGISADEIYFDPEKLHAIVIVPFYIHSYKALKDMQDKQTPLDISLSTTGIKTEDKELVRVYKFQGRVFSTKRQTKGTEATFLLEAAPEMATFEL